MIPLKQEGTLIPEDPLICYLLTRTDLPDYLSGKSMAQAHHAGVRLMIDFVSLAAEQPNIREVMLEYAQQADGFGVTVNLGVTYREMRELLGRANLYDGVINGVVTDPSYPIRDGDRVGHMVVDTCGYIFGRRSIVGPIVEGYPLFREPK